MEYHAMIFLIDVNAIERCIVMKNTWYPCNEQTEGNESLLRGNSNQPPQQGSRVFQVRVT